MIPTKTRVAQVRARQAAAGLKRIEVLIYPDDEQAIRNLAELLRLARTAKIEANASSGYPSSTNSIIASI